MIKNMNTLTIIIYYNNTSYLNTLIFIVYIFLLKHTKSMLPSVIFLGSNELQRGSSGFPIRKFNEPFDLTRTSYRYEFTILRILEQLLKF